MARRPPLRYDGDLRADLLAAAQAEVAERGSAAVSLRAIARRAGVSHAAPAHHFGDKAGVLTALAAEGFQRLTQSMRTAIANSTGQTPAREVQAAGLGYLRFALAHPALFDVMWQSSSLHRDDPSLRLHGDAAHQVLVDAIAAAQERGWGVDHDGALLSLLLWSWVHGFAVLWLDGPLGEQAEAAAAEGAAAEGAAAEGPAAEGVAAADVAAAGVAPDGAAAVEMARAMGRILIQALAPPTTAGPDLA